MKKSSGWVSTAGISLVLLGALAIRCAVAPSNGYMGIEADFIEYKQAMHRALTLGIHEVYTPSAYNDPAMTGKEWDGGYFITNPPGRIYSYWPFVWVYRHFSPEGFELWHSNLNFFDDLWRHGLKNRIERSRGFSIALKLPAILADIIITLVIFIVLKACIRWKFALLAASLYAFTPGIIIDSADFGSHDAMAMMLLVLSLWSVIRQRLEVAAALFVLAALNKPQAAALLLYMVFLGWRYFSPRRILFSVITAFATAVLVFMPFILYGTFTVTLSALIHATFGGEPFVSLNAANLWWCLSMGRGAEIPDTTTVFGIVTFRTIGLVMFLLANVYAMYRLSRVDFSVSRIFFGAAFVAIAYFIFNTELHENHMIYVLPLLLLAVPCHWTLWGIASVLALTLTLNLVLLDPGFYAFLHNAFAWNQTGILSISVICAGVNVVAFIAMADVLRRSTLAVNRDPLTPQS